ncbi:MAG: MFS transporter, partial [Firmicutes bacterium]|nr:MFS transporter [Bacillota bacterium]
FMIYGGCVLPILVVTALTGAGFDPRWSWTAGAGVIGALSMAIGVVAYLSVRDVAFIQRDVAPEKTVFLQAAKEILRLKPMRCFLPCVFFFLFGSAMCSANQDYLLIYAVGVSPDAIKYSALFTMLAFLFLTPVFTAIATKWDRKPALLLAFAVSVLGSLACRVHGIDSMGIMYVLTVCQAVGLVGFWTLFYPFAYDIVELDEYRNRKSRAGTITAFPHFCQEFGNACGLQAIGIILKLIGYDPAGSAQTAAGAQYAAQSAATVSGIQNISTVFLAVCICISAVCILLYPLNKKRYAKVQAANERRRAGETEFSDPEVDAIL